MGDVECRDRLVEQHDAGILRHQHGKPGALPLTAGQFIHQTVGETVHVGQHQRLLDMPPVFRTETAECAMPGITPECRQFAHREARCRRRRLRQVGERAGELAGAPLRQRPLGEGDGA